MRTAFGLLLLVSAVATTAAAQTPALAIESAWVSRAGNQISVTFSHEVEATGPHTDITRVHLKDDRGASTSITGSISRSLLELQVLDVRLSAVLPTKAREICFDEVRFVVDKNPLTTTDEICRALGTQEESDAEKKALVEALGKVPLPAQDRDLFASGFVTTASDDSTGGADLSIAPNIGPVMTFLKLKKATTEEGDSKQFEAGAKYRVVASHKASQIRRMRTTPSGQALNDLLRERQQNILAGWIIDAGAKLEGEPTNFDVSNFVGETAFQLHTMTKGFLGRTGFWRGFVLPVGVELGQSLATTVPETGAPTADGSEAEKVNKIARYKGGAGFTVYYDRPHAQIPLRRVELDINAVARYLGYAESRYNEDTKKIDITDNGWQTYAQVDLKVFFGETQAGRYGMKLSFNRGRLPPVYSEVKSFTFGFVIESGDDDGKATAERQAAAPGR
jgi:hypothetical protein